VGYPKRLAAFLFAFLLLTCCVASGKKKPVLPADVVKAQTVLVLIDPSAGVVINDPNANYIAREDVEKALMKWGRFTMANDVSTADLVICLRKGHEKIAEETIGGIPNNNRHGILQPTDSGIRAGGSQGSPPMAGDPTNPQASDPAPQLEVGAREDTFAIYRGKRENVLNNAPVWRYQAKDALESPSVPAVDVFRKLMEQAEKQLAGVP
jgi:hypothetical protein